jgi:hypothetical protein
LRCVRLITEYEGDPHLGHDIRRGHGGDALHTKIIRNLLQRRRDIDLILREPLGTTAVLGLSLIGLALESALSNRTPGSNGHPFLAAHGEEVALQIADGSGPAALVDDLAR